MNKGFMHESKERAMGLFWVTARQVVWRTQPAGTSTQPEKKDDTRKKDDHPRR